MGMRFNSFRQLRKSQYAKRISLLLIIMSLSLMFSYKHVMAGDDDKKGIILENVTPGATLRANLDKKKSDPLILIANQGQEVRGVVGRLKLAVFDALDKPRNTHINIYRDGKGILGAWTEHSPFDLPPGAYEVQFDYAQGIRRNVEVTIGQVTNEEVRGVAGRLKLAVFDALDKPRNTHINIYRDGKGIVGAWTKHSPFDLPPGTYEVRFDIGEGIMKRVTVRSGRTEVIQVRDGTTTITKKDSDGTIISEETFHRDKQDEVASFSATDHETGITTTSVRNPDGSRTVTKTDKDGNIVEREVFPPKGEGLSEARSYDPETGETTVVVKNADGSKSIVKSKTTTDPDGTQHTTAMDEEGNSINTTITPEGIVKTTKTDIYGNTKETILNEDGSITSVEKTVDGYTIETSKAAGGEAVIVKKDLDGSVMETITSYEDGTSVHFDKQGNITEELPVNEDGEIWTVETDKKGNEKVIVKNTMGEVLYTEENRVTPKDQGREYYETVIGGSDWDDLPKSSKTRYAGSERRLRENAEIIQLHADQEAEDRRVKAEEAEWLRKSHEETDRKLAAIAKEQETADQVAAERKAKRERKLELQESYETAEKLQNQYDEAIKKGDRKEAFRIEKLQDEHHEKSMDVLEFTAEEEKEMQRKSALRQKLMDKIRLEARFEAEKADQERIEYDEYKDLALEGGSWLSVGAEQQKDLAKSNRQEDRMLSYTEQKDKIIERMLNSKDLTSEERDILIDIADMSSVQRIGALEKKAANNRIVAAGYAIDAAMLATGGLGNAAVGVGSKVVGKAVAVKVAGKAVARNVAKGMAIKTAIKKGLKSGLKVGEKIGEKYADKLVKLAQYDLKTAASKKVIEKVVARETAKNVLTKKLEEGVAKEVAEATAKKVGDRMGKKVAEELGKDISEKGLINTMGSKGGGKIAEKMAGKETGLAVEKALAKKRSIVPESVKNMFGKKGAETDAKTPVKKTAKIPSKKTTKTPTKKTIKTPVEKLAKVQPKKTVKAPTEKMAKAPTKKTAKTSKSVEDTHKLTPESPKRGPKAADDAGDFAYDLRTPEGKKALDKHTDLMAEGRGHQPYPDSGIDLPPQTDLFDRPGFDHLNKKPKTPSAKTERYTPSEKAGIKVRSKAKTQPMAESPHLKTSKNPGTTQKLTPEEIVALQAESAAAEKTATQPLSKAELPTGTQKYPEPDFPTSTEKFPELDFPTPTEKFPAPEFKTKTQKLSAAESRGGLGPKKRLHGDPTMSKTELADFAKNPRVKTKAPKKVDAFKKGRISRGDRRRDFVKARSAWKKKPNAVKEEFDEAVRSAIDEAAAMGDKWAKRLQKALNDGDIKYFYEPGLNSKGIAPRDGTVLINPLKGRSHKLGSADEAASTLLHEFAHSWKGPKKYKAEKGLPFKGSATKGEYNEVRAFMAEAKFNQNLMKARKLNDKPFDDTVAKELDELLGTDILNPSRKRKDASMARGLEARKNLQEGLVDDYSYGDNMAHSRSLGAERLSTYRGGSMRDIRQRLRDARGPLGEHTPEYEAILREIREAGGRTQPMDIYAP